MLIAVWNSWGSELCCCGKMEGCGRQLPPQCCTALQEGEGELRVWITEEGTPRKVRLTSWHKDWLKPYAHGSEQPGSHKTVKKCYDVMFFQSLGAALRWAGSSERAQGHPEGCGSAMSQAGTSRPGSAWCGAPPSLPSCSPRWKTLTAQPTFGSFNKWPQRLESSRTLKLPLTLRPAAHHRKQPSEVLRGPKAGAILLHCKDRLN